MVFGLVDRPPEPLKEGETMTTLKSQAAADRASLRALLGAD